MGMFAGAVFIRNEEQLTKEQLIEIFTASMQEKSYTACDEEQAQRHFAFAFSGKWFSICGTEEELPMNLKFADTAFQKFPMFTADLVDSDFVEICLFDADDNITDHRCIGEPYWGDEDIFGDATDISAWSAYLKEGVTLDDLLEAVDAQEVFAESAFDAFGELIELDSNLFFDERSIRVLRKIEKLCHNFVFQKSLKKFRKNS